MTTTRRVLVTGSRNWPTPEAVWAAINAAIRENPPGVPTVIVHGDCPTGADSHASQFCQDHPHLVTEERHPADWSVGKQAGPARNQAMVDLGADVCLAFPLGESRGTRHCMTAAADAGIPVTVIPPLP